MKRILSLIMLAAMALAPWGSMQAKAKAVKEKSPITIGTIIYHLDDIDAQFKALHDAGFTSCQINWSSAKMTPELAQKIIENEQKYGIKATTVVGVPGNCKWNFTQGPATIGLVPADDRDNRIAEYHKMIDFCQLAKVPAMHSHFGFIPEDMSDYKYKTFISVMKQLAQYAKDRGVSIYFETGQETPITLVRAIKDIGYDNLGINCDVANLLLYGKANPTDAIKLFGPLVKDIHAKDGKYPTRDNPYELGQEKPIPEGDVDFPAIIKYLKQEGYKGAITIEYELNLNSMDYMVKTRKYLQDLIDNE